MAAIHSTQVGEDGPWVVFLHGLFGQGKNFTRIAKGLQPELRSLLVDLPDHGRSDWTERVDYVAMADAVAAHVEETAGGPVHLVGHSMGGKVAMVLALRHPHLVERLVVVDISPGDSAGSGEFEHLLGSLARVDLTTVSRRSDADAALRDPIPEDTVRGFLLQNLRSTEDGYAWQANLDVLRRDLDVIAGFPELDTTYDGPVLWIAGQRSSYVTDADEPRMRELFGRTRLVTVKDAGHWVHSEQPEAFISILRAFLLT